ncbi:MAG: hypothetical protein JW798_06935 [Prolixibacteraceae bacterium]|nr:hypothetical protein [Prolixibacteraceae bacterium]
MFHLLCDLILKIIRKIPVLLLFLLFISVCRVFAQSGLIGYGSQNTGDKNPSFLEEDREFEASLFPLTNIEADLYLPFSLNTLFSKAAEGGYEIDLGELTEKLASKNQAMFCFSAGYLSFSANIRSNRWMFRASENFVSSFEFDGELVSFINQGNKAYMGQWFETFFPFGYTHFSTIQATTSRVVSPKIKVGFSAKMYFGKSTVDAKNTLMFYTDERADYVDFKTEGNILASFPLRRNIHPDGYLNGWELNPGFSLAGYLFNLSNPGLGVDAGIEYKHNDKWLFSAALTDLGFISWFSGINSINVNKLSRWDGFDISPIVYYRTDEDVFDEILNLSFADSFLFSALTPVGDPFVTLAPLKVVASATYSFSNKLNFMAINQLQVNGHMLRESFLLMAGYMHDENWEFRAGLSFTNHSFFNLPVGVYFHNERITASLSISNLWGLALPDYSRQFGGTISMMYKFQLKSIEEINQMKRYPFSNPYRFTRDDLNQP